MDRPDDIVWLYKVYDTKEMSAKELQHHLDTWSNHEMPHELIVQDTKLIVRYQSGLLREAYFWNKLQKRLKEQRQKDTFKNAAD